MNSTWEDTKQWFEYAYRDIDSAKFLQNMHPQPLEIICFHCQQAAEKALKGILVFHGVEPSRTHALPALYAQCCQYMMENEAVEVACKHLTSYGVQPCYPKSVWIDEHDMLQALQQCDAVLQHTQSELERQLAADNQPVPQQPNDEWER